MYDYKKRRKSYDLKVKDVIAELEKENQEAIFTCCGDNYITFHVEENNSVVTIDNEDLDDCYEDGDWDGITPIPEVEKDQKEGVITLPRALEMITILAKNNIGVDDETEIDVLENLGFTPAELRDLGYIIFDEKPKVINSKETEDTKNESKENAIREITDGILDAFENLLEEKDITIPSDDREGEEGEARLYGSEYYELETKVSDILTKSAIHFY